MYLVSPQFGFELEINRVSLISIQLDHAYVDFLIEVLASSALSAIETEM